MFRQLVNLRNFGRFRSAAPTPRAHKPSLLKQQPDLEIHNLLELATVFHSRPRHDFFFVQIGAFDGRAGDPLRRLVRRHHWRGILVEPQPTAFQTLQSNYAGETTLQFYNVAIGPTDGELTLYTRRDGDVSVASTTRHLLIKPGHPENKVVALQVPCWTLQTLLANAKAPSHIDLLQIDVEGFDYEIIRSIDFSRIKPAIIRYEHVILSQRDRNACLSLLASHGYRFLLEDRDTTALLDDSLEHSLAASA